MSRLLAVSLDASRAGSSRRLLVGKMTRSVNGTTEPSRIPATSQMRPAWLSQAGRIWLVAGILLGSVVPFTLLVIFPTNKRLEDPALDASSETARSLLIRWGHLHAVRSVLSLVALLLMLFVSR